MWVRPPPRPFIKLRRDIMQALLVLFLFVLLMISLNLPVKYTNIIYIITGIACVIALLVYSKRKRMKNDIRGRIK